MSSHCVSALKPRHLLLSHVSQAAGRQQQVYTFWAGSSLWTVPRVAASTR